MSKTIESTLAAFRAQPEFQLLTVLKDHVITDDAQNKEASEFLKQVKGAFKAVDEARQEFVRPLNTQVKAVNDQFRPVLDRLTETEGALKRMVGAYILKQQAEQRALAAKAAEAAAVSVDREEFKQAMAMTQAAAPVAVRGVSAKTVWKFQVLDGGAVPREFCSPDEAKIRGAVAAGARDIPGVRIFEDQVVSVRS